MMLFKESVNAETGLAQDRGVIGGCDTKREYRRVLGPRSHRGMGEVLICQEQRIPLANLGYPRDPTLG